MSIRDSVTSVKNVIITDVPESPKGDSYPQNYRNLVLNSLDSYLHSSCLLFIFILLHFTLLKNEMPSCLW